MYIYIHISYIHISYIYIYIHIHIRMIYYDQIYYVIEGPRDAPPAEPFARLPAGPAARADELQPRGGVVYYSRA